MSLNVTQNINKFHITAVQNNQIVKLQPIINTNSSDFTETDPIFQASEAALFEPGDKANLDNQSGVNTGDETTSSIQAKRPLKTINGESLEGSGNVQIDYNDLDNLPVIPIPLTNHSDLNLDDGTNPHGTTKNDVGLSNVNNTSDLDKPVSTATQLALNLKENTANKATNFSTINDTLYPSVEAVKEQLDLKLNNSGYSSLPLPVQSSDIVLVNRGGTWYSVSNKDFCNGDVYFINSSQNVTNAMHDRILIFTGNYTLTFVSGLRSDFKTVVTANNAVTGNFAFTGTTNSSESDGSILTSGGMCAIFQTTTNTFRLKGGGLI